MITRTMLSLNRERVNDDDGNDTQALCFVPTSCCVERRNWFPRWSMSMATDCAQKANSSQIKAEVAFKGGNP